MKVTFVGQAPGSHGLPARLKPTAVRIGAALGLSRAALSVMLTDDEGIRDYNRRFRGKDEPTDVLSFPTGHGNPADSGHYLGDLVLSVETAAAQAADHGHSLAEECEVLLLHGILHLLGHDHETDEGEMREVESRLARELLGSTRGLIARVERGPGGRARP